MKALVVSQIDVVHFVPPNCTHLIHSPQATESSGTHIMHAVVGPLVFSLM